MKIVICLLLSYLLGTLSPAALIARVKKVNLREQGSGNVGGTNTMLVVGKGYGAAVMIFDILKGFLAAKLSQYLLPEVACAGILAGLGTILGHIFPFYMHFRGGRGFAPYVGMVIATDGRLFLLLLVVCVALALLINHAVALPISACVLFTVLMWATNGHPATCALATAASLIVIAANWGSVRKVLRGEDKKARDQIRALLGKGHKTEDA